MSSVESTDRARLTVSNVGGIESTSVDLPPGVTVLEGRNATNRTSLLSAIAAAMGSDQATLKSDADRGEVQIQIGDETYSRTFERTRGGVSTGGDPYLDDAETAELFAFLFGTNEARQAVRDNRDLREIIMRPIDTTAIKAEIQRLEANKRELRDTIEELSGLDDRLPELEARRENLQGSIEETTEKLQAAREKLEAADADSDQRQSEEDELDERLSELNDLRSTLEDVEFRIDSEAESLDSLRAEREQLEADRDELDDAPEGELDRVDTELSRLRERKRSVESTISQLHQIVEFNEELLAGEQTPLSELGDGGDVTEGLLADEERTVTCWTCGSDVERAAIDDTLEELRDLRREKSDEREEIDAEISELTDERKQLREARQRHEEIERKIDRVEEEIEEREATLERERERREEIQAEIDDLESKVERLRQDDTDAVLDQQQRVSELAFERQRLEEDLADVESEIEEVKEQVQERERLEQRLDTVDEQLSEQRTRIERIETEAVEAFNDHMANLLDRLDYGNVDRVWIERKASSGRGAEATFDLHVVRSTDDGAAYEDSLDTLSESEREVIGMVFALAGYLAHDVHESVPFVLLDSLEAIDADRIARLVDYFADHADYLVVALLPEDAQAVGGDHRITEI